MSNDEWRPKNAYIRCSRPSRHTSNRGVSLVNSRAPAEIFSSVGSDLFHELRSYTGETHDAFSRIYLPVFERFAMAVCDLPLQKGTFERPTGAFLCGFHSALSSLKMSGQIMFRPGISMAERTRLDPQYRWCAVAGCLTTVLVICYCNVSAAISGSDWTPWDSGRSLYHASLVCQYEATWREVPFKAIPAFAFGLAGGLYMPGQFRGMDDQVIRDLMLAVNPGLTTSAEESPLAKLVRDSISHSLEQERRRIQAQVLAELAGADSMKYDSPMPREGVKSANSTGASGANPVTSTNRSEVIKSITSGNVKVNISPGSTGNSFIPKQNLDVQQDRQSNGLPASTQEGLQQNLWPSNTPDKYKPAKDSTEKKSDSQGGLPTNVMTWMKAVAAEPSMRKHLIQQGGKVLVTKHALNFGSEALTTYTMLHEAGLVESRTENGAICVESVASAFKSLCDKQ